MNYKKLLQEYKLEKGHWWFRAQNNLMRCLLKRFKAEKPILIAGCSIGIDSLGKKDPNIFRLDISKEKIDFCRKRRIKNMVNADACSIPFKENYFNTIITFDVLEHIDNDKKALSEFYRILKRKGKIFILVPAVKALYTKHDMLIRHKRRYSSSELKGKILKAGFKIIKMNYWNFFMFPIIALMKLLFQNHNIRKTNSLLNKALFRILDFERFFVSTIAPPFGISLVCIAKK